jgi:heptosyltransferase-2
MTTFAEIRPPQLRTECRHYTGYKPCNRHDGCPTCPVPEPRGAQTLLVAGSADDAGWLVRQAEEVRRLRPGCWLVCLVPAGCGDIAEVARPDELRVGSPHGLLAVAGRPWAEVRIAEGAEVRWPRTLALLLQRHQSTDSWPIGLAAERGMPQVLVIKLGAMGDVLRSKAILPGLRATFPGAAITWLTERESLPLVAPGEAEEVLPFTDESVGLLLRRHFTAVICLDKDPHAVALSGLIDTNERRGFAPTAFNGTTVWNDSALYALRLGLSDEFKFRINKRSMPDVICEAAGVPYDGAPYPLVVPMESVDRVATRMAAWRARFGDGVRFVGLNTGCGPVFATKAWPVERMEEFLAIAARREDVVVVLLGGRREAEIHARLMAAGHARVVDGGSDNSLLDFFALVGAMDVVLSADSLAMHIAVALRRRVVAWFGATCPQEIDLYNRGERLVVEFECSPCYLKRCPKPVFCMSTLTGATMMAAVDRQLAAGD